MDEFDLASQLAAERGWLIPAYHLPPDADEVKLMRILVKLTLGYSLAEKLAEDLADACKTLKEKGGVHVGAQAGPHGDWVLEVERPGRRYAGSQVKRTD